MAEALFQSLANLEDTTLYTKKSRAICFKMLKSAIDGYENVAPLEIQRVLSVFVHCMKEDIINVPHALSAVQTLLTNIKRSPVPVQDYLPSAMALLNLIKTECLTPGTETLRKLSFDVFLSYPVDVLAAIASCNCSDLIEVFEVYRSRAPLFYKLSEDTCYFLHKLLKILPPDAKSLLVKEGLTIWFGDLIPTLMIVVERNDTELQLIYLECIEMLVNDLLQIDFKHCLFWQFEVLKCICIAGEYPAVMKKLLETDQAIWHRLWIVFIQLLKDQVTSFIESYGTPINSMLPVVEMALKMDAENRCYAFQCWEYLIENFSKVTRKSDSGFSKRIKLLIIPLKSNNAKNERTSLAKFNCWWHMITAFNIKLDSFTSDVLLSFMVFAFGRDGSQTKVPITGVAQLYGSLKNKCIEAFVNIIGHTNCHCYTSLPRLETTLTTRTLLVTTWSSWMHVLKEAISLSAEDNMYTINFKNNEMPVLCAWKTLTMMLADLPNNGIRRDLLTGLIQVMQELTENCSEIDNLPVVLLCLALNLFEDEKVKELVTSNPKDPPAQKILMIVFNREMNDFYSRCEGNIKEMLKPMIMSLLESKRISYLLDNFLDTLPATNTNLKIWGALAETLTETDTDIIAINIVIKVLMWPVNAIDDIVKTEYCAKVWHTLYNTFENKICIGDWENDILRLLNTSQQINTKKFRLFLAMALLKNKLKKEEDIDVIAAILEDLMSEMHDYKKCEEIVPALVEINVLMINHIIKNHNKQLAKLTLNCTNNILKVIYLCITPEENDAENLTDANGSIVKKLFDALKGSFEIPIYSEANCDFLYQLREYLLSLNKESALFKIIEAHIRTLLNNAIFDCSSVSFLDQNNSNREIGGNINDPAQLFTIPDTNKVNKSAKKKEACIVNTVMENGEEYVVVKSNWKFNPRKLTDTQKEKMQRKREDIPALYQDLSQSQDQFRLSTTDSQDTTSSNSKTDKPTTNNDASSALKNITSSNVIPTIMENILSDKDIDTVEARAKNSLCTLEIDKVKQTPVPTPKNKKYNRMSLKDRINQNMRKLVESASVQNSSQKKPEEECQIKQVRKTPTKKQKNNTNIETSATSLLPADRPSRVKRVPKKFNDVQMFGLKKRLYSNTETHSDSSIESDPCNGDKKVDTLSNKNTERTEEGNIIDIHIISTNQEILEKNDIVEHVADLVDVQTVSGCRLKVSVVTDCSLSDLEKIHKTPTNAIAQNGQENEVNLTISSPNHDAVGIEKPSDCDINVNDPTLINTPVTISKEANLMPTSKKRGKKKSRIENELAIDMVEGHPFLNKQSLERVTRKNVIVPYASKRKRATDKLNISKNTPKVNKRLKEKVKKTGNEKSPGDISITVEETQEKDNSLGDGSIYDGPPCSEDVIESSQDSTFTAISAKSTKRTPKRAIVSVERKETPTNQTTQTQDLLQDSDCIMLSSGNKSVIQESNDDIELPQNKTAVTSTINKNQSELTENMDTESLAGENMSEAVISTNDDDLLTVTLNGSPITLNLEKTVGPDTQELAEADTQPNNPSDFEEFQCTSPNNIEIINTPLTDAVDIVCSDENVPIAQENDAQMDTEPNISLGFEKDTEVLSSFNDEDQRKQDFMNNTSEISPIKVLSPDREKNSPPQETSNDYVLVKLTSPVQSNGEPFDRSGSPEIFTEDKTSPDERDQSPPRAEVSLNSISPSSALSLKKNKPQVAGRPGGRAAHMLGLCVPDSLNTMKSTEIPDQGSSPKESSSSTPAKRKLRLFYNSSSTNNEDKDTSVAAKENFLNFKKSLPSSDVSPSVPILKRKLAYFADDAAVSPASKRKRVSFHDPPVSTTVSVQKYIEPGNVRSPSHKRLDRPTLRTYSKSPKRLENCFVKLDTILSKAVQSFTKEQLSLTSDTNNSLDITPAVEIVKTSELNDIDPICPELADCEDSIVNMAVELSSPAMKDLFIKELEGKVSTVGDLAKMTELEVNRLCIKAPKVQIAKKVLNDYINKKKDANVPEILVNDTGLIEEMVEESEIKTCCIETQTDQVLACDNQMQTDTNIVESALTQTDIVTMATSSIQTTESGFATTSDIITTCLYEREDFIDRLIEHLDETALRRLAEKLPTKTIIELLAKKCDDSAKIDLKTLILFCGQFLQNGHDISSS